MQPTFFSSECTSCVTHANGGSKYTPQHTAEEGGDDASTTRDLHYAGATKNLAQLQMQLETKATTKPKVIVIAAKVAEQFHLARRGRVKREKAPARGCYYRLWSSCGRAGGLFETQDAI